MAIAPATGENLEYRISTFDPQAEEIAYELQRYLGIQDDGDGLTISNIVDSRVLRQASVFGILSTIFAACATGQNDPCGYWEKSMRYQELFKSSRAQLKVGIDTTGDSVADEVLVGGSFQNTGEKNQSESLSTIWGENVLVSYAPASPTVERPSFGYRFRWVQPGLPNRTVERHPYNSRTHSEEVEVGYYQDEKITGSSYGHLIVAVNSST